MHKTYKELNVWKSARELCTEVYSVSALFPSTEQFGLINQIRRAVISIVSNIAEGHGRQYKKETIQFFHMAKASVNEVESQLLIAQDLKFITQSDCDKAEVLLETTRKQLIGFIKYLNAGEGLK